LYPDFFALDPTHVWVWTLDRLYITRDAGRHWQRSLRMRSAPSDMSIDFVDPRHGFGYPLMDDGPHPYLYVTRDGGRTWQQQQSRVFGSTRSL
jgi:photosystem II stability/assembly factor-like uncharacterized protein